MPLHRPLLTSFVARWIAASRARPQTTLFLVAVLAVLVSCHPIIFLGKSFVSPNNGAPCLYPWMPLVAGGPPGAMENAKGSDIGAMMWSMFPYAVVEHHAIFDDHEIPLRNRFSGYALLGQGQSMLGDPLHWIPIAAAGAPWAWDLKFLLSRLLWAFGIGLLVRVATGRLAVGALLGASSVFIGFFAYRLNHPACFSLGYAPWILLAWWKIALAPGWRAAVPAAALLLAANWCEFNSGTAKEAVMLIAGLNGTGLLVAAFLEKNSPLRLRKVAVGAAALFIFVLLSAPCWLVFLDALSRAYTIYSAPLTFQISPALLTGLFDDLFYRQTAPQEVHSNPAANFLVLLGALWAVAAARRLRTEGGCRALVLGMLPAFALAFGIVPVGLIEKTPFLRNVSHVDNTFSCVLIVLLFPIAGFGLRACLETRGDRRWLREWWHVLLLAALLAALFFGHTQAHARIASGPAPGPGFPAKSAFFIGYATALFFALAALPWALRALGRRVAIVPLLGAMLALGAIHFRHSMYGETTFDAYVVNPQERVDLLGPTPALEALRRAQVEPGRVLGFGGVLTPGFNAALGFESPASADALVSPYWREFVEAAGLPIIWSWRLMVTKEQWPARRPFLDLLNVRHYLATPSRTTPAPGLQSLGTADLEVLASPTAWPRAFFTDSLSRYRTVQDFTHLVATGDGRPFAAVAEGEAAAPALRNELSERRIEPASGYRLTANSTEFTLDAPAPGVALLGESYEAGCFHVFVNGRPATSFRANHLFQAVALPQAGRYVIRFTYEPPVWKMALTLAGAGLALLLGALAACFAIRPSAEGKTVLLAPHAEPSLHAV